METDYNYASYIRWEMQWENGQSGYPANSSWLARFRFMIEQVKR